ncbi:unnamed protein product [Rhizopus stolonifer]
MSDSHRTIENPVYVSENLLKKRKRNEKAAAERAQERLDARKKQRQIKKTQFKRADEFVRNFRMKKDQIRRVRSIRSGHNKLSKQKGDSQLIFVARIKTDKAIHKTLAKSLKNLRLTRMNSGVFAQCNNRTMKDLMTVERYVTYGKPSLKTVRDLIMKRGNTMVKGKITPLNNNAMIEEALGKYDIICLEDIIHEVSTLGKNFSEVTKYLEPFRLHDPVKGWRQKKLNDVLKSDEDESAGDDINKLVDTMN